MPLQATSGAASYDAFGGGVPVVPAYIEEVFSTQVYTGTGATNNIVNGIDLAGKGGLVWTKARTTTSAFTFAHALMDTLRGAGIQICSDRTDANTTQANSLTSFNSDGYTLGADTGQGRVNNSSYGTQTYVGWTFRKQPKFFDVVTYTGNGASSQVISHSLGSVPGCVIFKKLNNDENWTVWHRSLAVDQYLTLNSTSAVQTLVGLGPAAGALTSTTITVPEYLNSGSQPFVAYLFAHNAGGFGLTGTDNVISCGSYTGNGSTNGPVVTLGYEPQWLMIKNASGANEWVILDNMRGIVTDGVDPRLFPNNSDAENTGDFQCKVSATGFQPESISAIVNTSGSTYIYIAIRRGPMKVPTVGTSVFDPVAYTGTGTNSRQIASSITPDSVLPINRGSTGSKYWYDRLRGNGTYVQTNLTNAELSDGAVYGPQFNVMQTGYQQGTSDGGFFNISSSTYVNYLIKRAPSFFDEVCYTGTGVARTVAHNLGVVPEMMIVKNRSIVAVWRVYLASLGATQNVQLDQPSAAGTVTSIWNNTAPTSSVFTVGTAGGVNGSGESLVAYLFATCAGVSKVGSYTGTGTTLQIDCGFTGGARFVLIKRTDSTGDWYVWDSARGIVAGNDPYLLLNSTAAEVTGTDYVDTYSAGFEISSTAPAAINASAGTFVFLAIA
jgi:hypothetical protein